MSRFTVITGVALALALGGVCLGQKPATSTAPAGSAPATGPASQPATGPAGALKDIQALLEGPRPRNLAEYEALLKARVPQLLKAVADMGAKYPDAPELHHAQMLAIVAASQLGRAAKDPDMMAKAGELAKAVLTSPAPAEVKMYADAHLLLLTIRPLGTTATQAVAGAEKAILDFTARYAKTSQAVEALQVGMEMADLIGKQDLINQLEQTLINDFPASPLARHILRRQGKSVDIGKVFKATLTRLDGGKLSLPDDLPGKVVVIDFWATWCGPCLAQLPDMKDLYVKYRPKGAEFVGVSLDEDKDRLAEFIKAVRLDWVQTFSGKGLQDPTAKEYGIAGPPSVWVIDKDGKVISDDAGENLAEILEKALSGATSAPAATAPAGNAPASRPAAP